MKTPEYNRGYVQAVRDMIDSRASSLNSADVRADMLLAQYDLDAYSLFQEGFSIEEKFPIFVDQNEVTLTRNDIVMKMIGQERSRQNQKWGVHDHPAETTVTGSPNDTVSELVQVAAVCVQWIECILNQQSPIQKIQP